MLFMRGRAHGKEFTHCWRCSDVLKCRSSWAADDRIHHRQQNSHEMRQ